MLRNAIVTVTNSGIPALFDKKSGNPKLIKRGEWGSGGEAPSTRRFSGFFNKNKAF